MLARIRIYSMLSNNTMHKCIDFMLVHDHKFVPSTNCLRRLKSYIPEGRNSAFSKKNPKELLKSIYIYISHELHPRGGGVTLFSTKIPKVLLKHHIYENLFDYISNYRTYLIAMFCNILNRTSGADV